MTSVVLEAGELSSVIYRSSSKSASLEYPCTAVRACLIVRALYILGSKLLEGESMAWV